MFGGSEEGFVKTRYKAQSRDAGTRQLPKLLPRADGLVKGGELPSPQNNLSPSHSSNVSSMSG